MPASSSPTSPGPFRVRLSIPLTDTHAYTHIRTHAPHQFHAAAFAMRRPALMFRANPRRMGHAWSLSLSNVPRFDRLHAAARGVGRRCSTCRSSTRARAWMRATTKTETKFCDEAGTQATNFCEERPEMEVDDCWPTRASAVRKMLRCKMLTPSPSADRDATNHSDWPRERAGVRVRPSPRQDSCACGAPPSLAPSPLTPLPRNSSEGEGNGLAALGADFACPNRIRTRRAQAAPDAPASPQREWRGEEQPEDARVEQRVDRVTSRYSRSSGATRDEGNTGRMSLSERTNDNAGHPAACVITTSLSPCGPTGNMRRALRLSPIVSPA
jgi:hypothetical protein